MSPEEFGKLTVSEFYIKVEGFGWLQKLAARGRADIVAAVLNASANRKRGSGSIRVDRLCPIKNPPKNIFFRQLFGLPF